MTARERRVLAVVATVIQIVLLAPNVVWPYFEDTGSFAASAEWTGRGLALYRDLLDQKPPGIFLQERLRLALFGSTPLAARLFELALLAVAGWMLGLVAELSGGNRRARAAVAVAFAALSSSALWRLPERGQVEFYQAAFVAIALGTAALVLRAPHQRAPRLGVAAMAGAASAWSCWLKPQAALITVAIALVLALRPARWKTVAAFVGGVAAVSALVVLRMWGRGELGGFVEVMFTINPAYARLPSGSPGAALGRLVHIFAGWRALVLLPAGLAFVVVLVRGLRGRTTRAPATLILASVAWAIAQFISGAYLFRYHAIAAIVPIALVLGIGSVFILERMRRRPVALRWSLAAALLAVTTINSRWVDCASSLVSWSSGALSTEALYEKYGREGHYFRYLAQVEAARVVRERVPPGEPFYVFGRAGVTYLHADRPPLVRVLATTMAYMQLPVAEGLRREIVRAVLERPPRLLLVRADDQMPWFGVPMASNGLLATDPELAPFVAKRYRRIGRIGESFLVFERCAGSAC